MISEVNIFSYVRLPYVYLLWKNACSGPLPIFWLFLTYNGILVSGVQYINSATLYITHGFPQCRDHLSSHDVITVLLTVFLCYTFHLHDIFVTGSLWLLNHLYLFHLPPTATFTLATTNLLSVFKSLFVHLFFRFYIQRKSYEFVLCLTFFYL